MKFDNTSRKHWTISSAAAVAAMIIVILMTSRFGIGISPDSACYFSIAENVVAGNGYAIYDLQPAVAWPPLYPTTLALAGLFDIDYSLWARILNVLLAGGIVLVTSLWLLNHFGLSLLGLIGVLGTLLSSALLSLLPLRKLCGASGSTTRMPPGPVVRFSRIGQPASRTRLTTSP